MPMRLEYQLLDVFSDRQFGGNQLAVFLEPPPDLPPAAMQKIARELNLSETTFLFPPSDRANDYRLRIFTPAVELPMAGHPTIGSAYALAHKGLLGPINDRHEIVFEEGVGPISVSIESDADGRPATIWMRQPLPRFMAIIEDRPAIAEMLGLAERDLADAPLQALSSGLPFLYVPLASLDAVQRAQLDLGAWRQRLAGGPAQNIFITSAETIYPGSSAHSRMFAPALGVSEDPATGSASGPLCLYLLRYGLAQGDEMTAEQGFQMGRPSIIRMRIQRADGQIRSLEVGGRCVSMGFGTLIVN